MGFFSNSFGFEETSYVATRQRLLGRAQFEWLPPSAPGPAHFPAPYPREKCDFRLEDGRVVSAGTFSFPSVGELRTRVAAHAPRARPSEVRVSNVVGEARSLHARVPAGGVVQAASQFNLLEFPSPLLVPEEGISAYVEDRTQGPACAVAAAAGTAYRNYLVPVPFQSVDPHERTASSQEHETPCEARGQTASRQLNGLADMEEHLVRTLGLPGAPWKVTNGYVESTSAALRPVNEWLASEVTSEADRDLLRSSLRIGVQEDATVTDDPSFARAVTQTYNAAISVGYSRLPPGEWRPVARAVLDGTYEATLLVGALAALRAAAAGEESPPVFLTKVGGGVFGNEPEWIRGAIDRAVERVKKLQLGVELAVYIVHYQAVDPMYMLLETPEDSGMKEL